MLNYKLKIGLIPERRFLPGPRRTGIFSQDVAFQNKEKCVKFLKENFADADLEFVDLEWLNKEGMLEQTQDAFRIAERFRQENVDAIFLIHCNFGSEEAAGKIAQLMGVPTLLWGPRDRVIDADGTRYTDTQCGLFSISKQLKRYNVPFTFLPNCDLEAPAFREGFEKFLSVATMVKNFGRLRILQIGSRVKPFKCVMANELELTENFGIDVVPMNMTAAKAKLEEILAKKKRLLAKHVTFIKKHYDVSDIEPETLDKMAAFIEFYKDALEENGCDVVATECWTVMNQTIGAMPCLAMSILADMGVIVICETDIHGAITSALLACAARGKKPTFFGEFTMRHPTNDRAELLWHCGVFATSLKKGKEKRKLAVFKPSFCVKDGHYTIARFQAEKGKYYLLGGEFDSTEGPDTFGTWVWAEFNDLEKLERKLVEGPYIHHMSEVEGSYADVLREFAKYVPGVVFDPLES
ncbi:MAG: fucose isomerase [Planctomycetia bacterium]|nr:fucose isomerase [Planctomycetia bacterium]